MTRTRRLLRVAGLNFLLVTAVVGFFVLIPLSVKVAYRSYSRLVPWSSGETRAALSNYSEFEWAEQHFKDLERIATNYRDFVVWRAEPFESPTITIESGGFRRVEQARDADTDEVWLFGGSAMWGVGSNDTNTIPSQLAQGAEVTVKNYAQMGYIARQSLNELINIYSEAKRPISTTRVVVFYDGVNEVLWKCQTENVHLGSAYESDIRDALAVDNLSPRVILQPAVSLIDWIGDGFDNRLFNSSYSCHEDSERSEQVARLLVNDWISADAIARSHGDRFVAVLQPVAYIGRPNLEHLDLFRKEWKELSTQYQVVYPLIRKYAVEAQIEFYDFSSILNMEEQVYIDFCHLSPNGNQQIAVGLQSLLEDG